MSRRVSILLAEQTFSPSAKKILASAGQVIDFGNRTQFLKYLPQADAVLTGLEVMFDAPLLDRATNIKLIASRTTQLRYLDLEETKRRGIKVINIKGNSPILRRITSTAEEAFALLLALIRKTPWAFDSIKQGKWARSRCVGSELSGKTFGAIGFGRLGTMVSRYAHAFAMRVIAYDPSVPRDKMARHGVKKVSLEVLLRESDAVSLHCVYNDQTANMLGLKDFRMMRRAAVFINTARGEIIDERALLRALREGWIAGAAVDTMRDEVPSGSHLKKNPLVEYARHNENLIIVPRLGGATREATERTQVYIAKLATHWIKRHLITHNEYKASKTR